MGRSRTFKPLGTRNGSSSPPEDERRAKPLEWSPRAWHAYLATLAFIAEDDPYAAQQVRERVEQALKQIAVYPRIGTPALPRGVRRRPIPRTGHVVNYRETRRAIRIHVWYRARQRTPR